jgi:diguanylate cyclase (GGDEF)-like protein
MGTGLGVADTMALIAPKLTYLVPFSACALFIRTDATDTLRCRFATGTDADLIERLSLRNGNGLTGWIAKSRNDLIEAGTAALPGGDVPTALQSALVCPLLFGDHFIGMLALYHTKPEFYGDDHRRLLDRVCEQAAAVVHNAMVFEQTQEDSLTDLLTGLPNIRFMRTHLNRELARAGRMKAEISMIVLDLNGFKAINDHHGHHIGDRALREIANVLRATVRPYDVVVRYAGDEFIVVLSECGREEAEDKREELQRAVRAIVFEPQPGEQLPLSISAGTAVFPHDGETYEKLLAEADRKMYENKSRFPYEKARDTIEAPAFDELDDPEAPPKPPTRH